MGIDQAKFERFSMLLESKEVAAAAITGAYSGTMTAHDGWVDGLRTLAANSRRALHDRLVYRNAKEGKVYDFSLNASAAEMLAAVERVDAARPALDLINGAARPTADHYTHKQDLAAARAAAAVERRAAVMQQQMQAAVAEVESLRATVDACRRVLGLDKPDSVISVVTEAYSG